MPTEMPNFAPDIVAELTAPKFERRKHYSISTYNAGCRGPLCRRAQAEYGRLRSQQKAEKDFRLYLPNTRGFKRDDARVEEIMAAVDWHWADLEVKRAQDQTSSTQVS